jgi:F-type H+/Na+-transporting ATPase subunit alpha
MEVGYVLSFRDFLVYLDGLPSAKVFDLVENEQGVRAVITQLLPNKVEAWVLDNGPIMPGQMFKKQEGGLKIDVTASFLGRAINPLGVPIDGKGPISKTASQSLALEQQPPGIESRKAVNQQLITGLISIDTLIPIGKGQRQLFIGDAHSGKTSILIDTVVNQIKSGTICIWASIGKPVTQLKNLMDVLRANKALDNTVIIGAPSTETSPLIFLAPRSAMTIAEYFQRNGKDVLVILDDMGIHAKIYRELSLLGGRSPGRESYPADIFSVHAHLMERAGSFNQKFGGASITAIPVIELNLDDFTGFIPTNLMGMTDGHLLFNASLRSQGQRPAIDVSLSVSRVGRQTQVTIHSLLSQKVRQILAEAAELETVSRFAGELPPETQLILQQKQIIEEFFKQDPLTFVPQPTQIMMLGLVLTTFFQGKDLYFVKRNKKVILSSLSSNQMDPFASSILRLQNLNQLVKRLETIVPSLMEVCK